MNTQAEDTANPAEENLEQSVPEIETVRAELEKYRNLALRNQADLENYRKRAVREKEEAIKYANLSLLERLIPVTDNFELGLLAARGAADAGSILTGMNMVHKQLNDFLKESGVEAIEAEGAVFDPNLHEALGEEEHSEVEEGRVLRQLRKGYKLRDRLLRPSNVIVSKGAPKSDATAAAGF